MYLIFHKTYTLPYTEGSEMSVLEGWDPVQTPIEHLLIEVKSFNTAPVRDFMARRGYL